jgi:hypothetical protein
LPKVVSLESIGIGSGCEFEEFFACGARLLRNGYLPADQ